MNKYRIQLIIALSLLSFPLLSQTFTITSYDVADVKLSNQEWRSITLADIETIRLHLIDSVSISSDILAIREWDDTVNLRLAYPGKWSIKQVWEGLALPKYPNAPGYGGVVKSVSDISFDFITANNNTRSYLSEGDRLIGIVVSNHSSDTYYADFLCADKEESETPIYFLPLLTTSCILQPGHTTFFPFKRPLIVDNNNNTTTVYILYSTDYFTIPPIPNYSTDKGFISLIEKMGVKCATRLITYNNE